MRNRRKQYLINKEFQIGFIYDFLKVVIFFIILMAVLLILFYYFKYQYGESIFNNYLLIVKKGDPIKVTNIFEIVAPVVIISSVIVVAFIWIYGIFYSHRIAGPIYRVKKTIDSICNGKLDIKVKLRKKDKFLELSDYLNNLLLYLNNTFNGLKEKSSLIKENIKEVKDIIINNEDIDNKKLKEIFNNIEKANLKINSVLNQIITYEVSKKGGE